MYECIKRPILIDVFLHPNLVIAVSYGWSAVVLSKEKQPDLRKVA